MDYDRLRDLQAKFDENPRRYFAPLANEYRKAGNPKRAIEICRAHLAQLPGHMSGQVVYGQALFEGAEFEEARKIFEGAIVLDPENLIALRALGDLALQAGNAEEARTWYKRLLNADPKDTAVVALIAEIDATGTPPTPESSFTVDFSFVDRPGETVSAAEAESTETPTEAASSPEIPVSDENASSAVEGLASTAPDVESPLANVEGSTAAAAAESALSDVEPQQPDPEPVVPPVRASAQSETASDEAAAPLGLERHYEEPEPSLPPAPAEAKERPEPIGADRDALDNWSPPASAAVHQEAAPDAGAQDGPASFADSSNPEPFVNETMAQLYMQQGYRQLALRVYRQLSEAKPEDQGLRDRIAEIVAQQTGEDRGASRARREEPSVESPVSDPAAPRSPSIESPLPHGPGSQPGSVESPGFDRQPVDSPASTPSREPDSVEAPVREEPRAEPEGVAARQPSVREFFATLGRRRPASPAPTSQPAATSWGRTNAGNGPAVAEPGTSASLDAVFAGTNVSAKDARAASALAGAFSASARGSSPPPPPSATPTPRGNPRLQTQESEEDVAKFRAWLDGLTGE